MSNGEASVTDRDVTAALRLPVGVGNRVAADFNGSPVFHAASGCSGITRNLNDHSHPPLLYGNANRGSDRNHDFDDG
jgi:hypothetical protein